jgi:Kef-type K+ transport system membrane component KefB
MDVGTFFLQLIAIFAAAKIGGELARRVGQPAVLGEMIGGIVVGVSGLGLVEPHEPVIHLLAELGVVLLLFLIGLETDLRKLLSVGGPSTIVAVVGVALPLISGYGVMRFLGSQPIVSLFIGASLTATSVGITARVLSDLGHLGDRESQIILGAAVLDDLIGLTLLSIATAVAAGQRLTAMGVGKTASIAFGFVVAAVVVGSVLAPRLIDLITRFKISKGLLFASLIFALTLAYLADAVGSGLIIGAFAAGLVLARCDKGQEIAREIHDLGQFFVPIFFVAVGAAIDLRTLNPLDPHSRQYLVIGLLLSLVGVAGKVAAGFCATGGGLRRLVIGVGMVPRGEVGLIFAQIGLSSGILSAGLYSSVALMVIITTLVAPPILRALLPGGVRRTTHGLSDIVVDGISDGEE